MNDKLPTVNDKPPATQTQPPQVPPVAAAATASSTGGRIRLFVAAALFIGWMAYLGYAALTKSRAPIVSHAQVAAAKCAVVAHLDEPGADGKLTDHATVVQQLSSACPAVGTKIIVGNLPEARGFTGPGEYLLLLTPTPFFVHNNVDGAAIPRFSLVGQLRSPGNDLWGVGRPAIYRWGDDVRKQFEKLWQQPGQGGS